MSQSRNSQINRRAVKTEPVAKVEASQRQGKLIPFLIAAVVIALILVIFGVSYYPTYIAPFRHVIISVDDITIRMDYFLKRVKLDGRDPMTMLRTLTQEQLVKLGAPRYGIAVTTEDITQELRRLAGGGETTISDTEFRAWLRQILNDTQLSETELRDITTTRLTTARLQAHLADRMPTVAEQVHLYTIVVKTEEEAKEIRTKWEGGEDFVSLARKFSQDEASRQKGGELGWFPPRSDALDTQIEYEAFRLDVGQVSEPIPLLREVLIRGEVDVEIAGWRLLLVAEKASREVAEEYLPALSGKVLDDWVSEEWKNHEVKWSGFNNGYDSETQAWINWQLAKK